MLVKNNDTCGVILLKCILNVEITQNNVVYILHACGFYTIHIRRYMHVMRPCNTVAYECTKVQNPRRHPRFIALNIIMRMCMHFSQENGRLNVWLSMEGVLDLRNGAVSEKNPQIFGPPLPAEYMTNIFRTNRRSRGEM